VAIIFFFFSLFFLANFLEDQPKEVEGVGRPAGRCLDAALLVVYSVS
jgi:hypothetical protein